MKKIFIFLIIVFYPSLSLSHMDHYIKFNKIEMEIFRNGELVGYNYYFFTKKNNQITVTNQLKFSISLLGVTVFQVEGYGEEKYLNDQLISYNSKTIQNNKNKYVNLIFDEKKNQFIIEGSSYKGTASASNIVGNWWNHKILQSDSQISPISGSIKKQIISFVGKDNITQYGETYKVDLFTLKSEDMSLPEDKRLDLNIWYDQSKNIILRVSYSRMGNWEYRLKSIE